MAENKKKHGAPSFGLNPDGQFVAYDEKGKEIPLPPHKISEEKLEQINKGKEKTGEVTITIMSLKNTCYVNLFYNNQWYCFKVDCMTGFYIPGPCV
jgi:hypothetical protein